MKHHVKVFGHYQKRVQYINSFPFSKSSQQRYINSSRCVRLIEFIVPIFHSDAFVLDGNPQILAIHIA